MDKKKLLIAGMLLSPVLARAATPGAPSGFCFGANCAPAAFRGVVVSSNGATIAPAAQLVDGAGNVWTVNGGVVSENGTTTVSSNVILLLYYNGAIYQENSSNLWWSWSNGNWASVGGDPRPASSYALTVTDSGSGTVTSAPSGINCGSTCSASFSSGTAVTLTAAPAAGYAFSGWSGACAGTGTCAVTMSAAKSATAVFVANGAGATTSASGATIPPGTQLVDSAKNVWTVTGGVISENGTATVSSNVILLLYYNGAVYQENSSNLWWSWSNGGWTSVGGDPRPASSYALTVSAFGSGAVTSAPSGINCGSTCSAVFNTGTAVTLTATPAAGATFGGWSGACSGTGGCALTMNSAQSVTATFLTPGSGSGAFGVKIVGNQLVNTQTGAPVTLRGPSYSGLEQGNGSGFETPAPDFTALTNGHMNAIRIPLNEETWLNINGCFLSGNVNTLHTLVQNLVSQAAQNNIYVLLDLHWAAPGGLCPQGQGPFLNTDHSVAFWQSIASTFKNYPNALFELFNEPFGPVPSNFDGGEGNPNMAALTGAMLNGATGLTLYQEQNNLGNAGEMTLNQNWSVQGTQAVVNAIRAAGATNVIISGSPGWDGDLEYWLKGGAPASLKNGAAGPPTDPLSPSQIAAAIHGYGSVSSWPGLGAEEAAANAILAAGYPVVMTETEGGSAVNSFWNFADSHQPGQISYLYWGVFSNAFFNGNESLTGLGQWFSAGSACALKGGTTCW